MESGRKQVQWITLIGDEHFGLEVIRSIEHEGCLDCYDVSGMDRYCVDFGSDHIFYDCSDAITDYSEEDLRQVPYAKPQFVTMIYTSRECVKKVLSQKNYPTKIYIDNDYGTILPIEEFIESGMPLGYDSVHGSETKI